MRFIPLGLAFLVALAPTAPVRADVLFQSIPDLTAVPANATVCSACSGTYQVYDKFNLAAPATITEVDFTASSLTHPQVTVGIYSLNGDLPGTLLLSQTFSTYSYSSVGHLTDIVFVFPSDWSLAAGSYDISFYNPANLKLASYIEAGRQYYQAGWGFKPGYSTGFDLIGSSEAAPEPASATLFGFALIGLAAVHRRRTASARSSRGIPARS